ncbi:MAG: Ig-like domain-containing protein [Clostridia bacterium]|nr:Ig-like domain-containing protein [Clostridia bacterium]
MKNFVKFIAVCLICALFALPLAACKTDDGKVTGVTLSKQTLTLEEGEEATLTATVTPDNATDKTVEWTSSAPSVATVTNGKVKAVAKGTATITAAVGGKSATCAVTVKSKSVAGKTYIFSSLTYSFDDTVDDETKQLYKDSEAGDSEGFQGTVLSFLENGKFELSINGNEVKGDYSLTDTAITLSNIIKTLPPVSLKCEFTENGGIIISVPIEFTVIFTGVPTTDTGIIINMSFSLKLADITDEPIAGEQLKSEAEWKAAFNKTLNADKLTVNINSSITSDISADGKTSKIVEGVTNAVKYDMTSGKYYGVYQYTIDYYQGGKKITQAHNSSEYVYLYSEGGTTYLVDAYYQNGNWEIGNKQSSNIEGFKRHVKESTLDSIFAPVCTVEEYKDLSSFDDELTVFDMFSAFGYDEESGSYKAKLMVRQMGADDYEAQECEVVVTFLNGSLIAYSLGYVLHEDSYQGAPAEVENAYSAKVVFSDIGDTTVELSAKDLSDISAALEEYESGGHEEVKYPGLWEESDWQAAFDSTVETEKFSVHVRAGYDYEEYFIDLKEGTIYIDKDGSNSIDNDVLYATENGTLYKIYFNGKDFVKEQEEKTLEEIKNELLSPLFYLDLGDTVLDLASSFADFENDEYRFIYNGNEVVGELTLSVSFEGKLADISYEPEDSENEFRCSFNYHGDYAYVPAWYEDEFYRALTVAMHTKFVTVTVTGTESMVQGWQNGTYGLSGNCIHEVTSEIETYVLSEETVDGEWTVTNYQRYTDESEWLKQSWESWQSATEYYTPLGALKYSYELYDEERDTYFTYSLNELYGLGHFKFDGSKYVLNVLWENGYYDNDKEEYIRVYEDCTLTVTLENAKVSEVKVVHGDGDKTEVKTFEYSGYGETFTVPQDVIDGAIDR